MIARADLAHCEALLRRGSKSFYAASRLLPRRVRDATVALYAFCRIADDTVDESLAPVDGVARLRARLARAYAACEAHAAASLDNPVDRAFAATIAQFRIPREVPEALLDGMEWDAQGRRYANSEELYAYCARVAASVGIMMTLVMGAREPLTLARACDLGVAMQLTNVARDVGEDAARGRLYLPADWMRHAKLDPDAWLARPVFDDALGSVVARLLETADALYLRADSGIALLPRDCRVAIRAARLIYADIGRVIRRARYDSVTRRAYVPLRRKLWLLLRAFLSRGRAGSGSGIADGPLAPAAFLVHAALTGDPP